MRCLRLTVMHTLFNFHWHFIKLMTCFYVFYHTPRWWLIAPCVAIDLSNSQTCCRWDYIMKRWRYVIALKNVFFFCFFSLSFWISSLRSGMSRKIFAVSRRCRGRCCCKFALENEMSNLTLTFGRRKHSNVLFEIDILIAFDLHDNRTKPTTDKPNSIVHQIRKRMFV